MMIKIIQIGSRVEVNNEFEGIIISASIRKKSVVYEVQKTHEDGITTIWANDWEITSKIKEATIVAELFKTEEKETIKKNRYF
jgi:hypothetical protein